MDDTSRAKKSRSRGGRRPSARLGFTLLELILALAIFALGLAIVIEAIRGSLENSVAAREMAEAQLLCESKMAELTARILPLENIFEASFDEDLLTMGTSFSTTSSTASSSRWLYSVEVTSLDDFGLNAVRVTVWRNVPPERRPTTLSVVRWILDEDVLAEAQAAAAAAEASSATSGGTTSAGSAPEGGGT